MPSKPTTAEEYVASFPPDVQGHLERLRALVFEVLPDATETIRYGMPAVMHHGHYVVHYAAWKHHIGLYPVPVLSPELEAEVAPLRASKDTVKLRYRDPWPDVLVRRILIALQNRRADPENLL